MWSKAISQVQAVVIIAIIVIAVIAGVAYYAVVSAPGKTVTVPGKTATVTATKTVTATVTTTVGAGATATVTKTVTSTVTLTASPTTKPPPAGKVTLEFWAPFAGEEATLKFWQGLADDFKKIYPNVEVKVTFFSGGEYWTKLTSTMAAGAPPDLFVTYGGGELEAYVEEGQAADLSEFLGEAWSKNIPEGVLKAFIVDGKLYALPFEIHSEWIFINKELFKKAGVPVPDVDKGWTWDEFLSAIRKFKEAGITPLAVAGKAGWELTFTVCYILVRWNGPDAFFNALKGKASFYDIYLPTFEKVKELLNQEPYQEGWKAHGYMDAFRVFSTGKAAMWVEGTWVPGMVMGTNASFPLSIAPFPYFKGKEGNAKVITAGPTGIAVAAASKHKDVAKDFLRFLARPENLEKYVKMTGNPVPFSNIPVDIYPEPLKTVMEKIGSKEWRVLAPRLGSAAPRELGSFLTEAIKHVYYGEWSPDQAAKAIEDKAKEVLAGG